MRIPPLVARTALLLLIASPSSSVTMEWTTVGNPGNAPDTPGAGGYGAVGYAYSIGTYEVTNSQYVEFLNAKAASDPFGLYSIGMAEGSGGIARTGSSGSYTYTLIAGREARPVGSVSFYDAVRFANWMNNGQGSGDTETGAYTLSANPVLRNSGATVFLPSEDEWYKAAYYNAATTSYFDYPAGSDTVTVCSTPTATPNRANCNFAVGTFGSGITNVGSYTGSASPYGTFDQGGNVWEWTEKLSGSDAFPQRTRRGGSYVDPPSNVGGGGQIPTDPTSEFDRIGFRVATLVVVPEPSTGLLVTFGLLGLAARRRPSA